MKRILLLLLSIAGIVIVLQAAPAKDYIVKTFKAPVWSYETVENSPVAGYLDYGDIPSSELDNDNPEWVYVRSGRIEGWAHVLSLRHIASEEEDFDISNSEFADYLRSNHVDESIIAMATEGQVSDINKTKANADADRLLAGKAASEDYMEPYSARGLEPVFIYIINEDVVCPVNDAYKYKGSAIRYEKTEEQFQGNTWFPAGQIMPDGIVMMSQGKGYDMPASAYHLMTEAEYLDYVNGKLALHINPEEGSLKLYLENHDIAQSKDWQIDVKDYTRRTVGDLWPAVLPIVVLLIIFGLSFVVKCSPAIWSYLAIADLIALCIVAYGYITMPSSQFNDYGGLAWILIAIVALICMTIVLFVSFVLGMRLLAHYDVKPSLKALAIGFGIGLGAAIILDVVMTLCLGVDKYDMVIWWTNALLLILTPIATISIDMIRQNRTVASALPAVLVLWGLALTIGLLLVFLAFCLCFGILVWMFFSGNYSGFKGVPGLVGSEARKCGNCTLYGTAGCRRSNASAGDSPCESWQG